MRVIGGELGGRRLAAPPGQATRPTSDRVREAVFSMLEPVAGARVLDLFAGSGAMGIEALSRGAASALFVERAPRAAAVLRRNLGALGLTAEVRVADAVRFLGGTPVAAPPYDLVFLDPPYAHSEDLIRQLGEPLLRVLAPRARVVLECERRRPATLPDPFAPTRERAYGDTLIRLYDAP